MPPHDEAYPLTPLRRGLIIAIVTIATALYALTLTIVNVALPQIQGAFSATQDQVAWVVTFNILKMLLASRRLRRLAGSGSSESKICRRRLWTIASATSASRSEYNASTASIGVMRFSCRIVGSPVSN